MSTYILYISYIYIHIYYILYMIYTTYIQIYVYIFFVHIIDIGWVVKVSNTTLGPRKYHRYRLGDQSIIQHVPIYRPRENVSGHAQQNPPRQTALQAKSYRVSGGSILKEKLAKYLDSQPTHLYIFPFGKLHFGICR